MLATVSTASLTGLESYRVEVQVDTAFGLPSFTIVGLGSTAIQESRERVKSAIRNSGFSFPTHRITVNLAPAYIRKDGAQFDLPIAVGILQATDLLRNPSSHQLFIAELSLDGRTKPVSGLLAHLLSAKANGFSEVYIPYANSDVASLIDEPELTVYAVDTLSNLVLHLTGKKLLVPVKPRQITSRTTEKIPDLSDVKGQSQAKRALEIAAAGGHNLLLKGPPGSGKTLLAQCLPGILPPLTRTELLMVTKLRSIANTKQHNHALTLNRPFRSPHHTASLAAVVGGGNQAAPGEISLAHHGVLFLDELPEFNRQVLESLRQPMEEKQLTLARANHSVRYPADFIFIGAANPCPCGYYGSAQKACACTTNQILAYQQRLSGPLLDRIDLHVSVRALTKQELLARQSRESSTQVRKRVQFARQIQLDRANRTNSLLTNLEVDQFCQLEKQAKAPLDQAIDQFALSTRAYYRLLKVARTIADLDRSDMIRAHHISEACLYRN